jgi:hypothetical protein
MALVDLKTLSPSTFPDAEDDEYEFKSSKANQKQMSEKLPCAVSAFANTGGGCLIWGVNDETGDPDGGIDPRIGNQSLRDWIDRILRAIEPPPKYDVELYPDNQGRGRLDEGKVIAAVAVYPSVNIPHMASDKKYYIRAGTHTVAAGHFLVEALRAQRQLGRPYLTTILKFDKREFFEYAELTVVNITSTPAIDVRISITPNFGAVFPIRLPVVDRDNPYVVFDVPIKGVAKVLKEVTVSINYKDIGGNEFFWKNDASLVDSLPPQFPRDEDERS